MINGPMVSGPRCYRLRRRSIRVLGGELGGKGKRPLRPHKPHARKRSADLVPGPSLSANTCICINRNHNNFRGRRDQHLQDIHRAGLPPRISDLIATRARPRCPPATARSTRTTLRAYDTPTHFLLLRTRQSSSIYLAQVSQADSIPAQDMRRSWRESSRSTLRRMQSWACP